MGAPVRSPAEIAIIINNAQQALGDIGLEVVKDKKRGKLITNRDHKDKVYRLILLRSYLQNFLLPDGGTLSYYTIAANERKYNDILTGLVNLSHSYGGPAIPLLGHRNLPLAIFGASSGGAGSGGPATPGGTVFQGTANSPATLIDTFNASISAFCFYIVSVSGSNSGEGSRTSIMSATWRGSNAPVYTETKTEDVGGITTPVTLRIELVAGKIQLNAYTTTDGWTITGVRILFQNISFVNPIGPLPAGGMTGQILAKSSDLDYQTIWETLTANLITDLTASATELNYSQGVTSAIQTQLNAVVAAVVAEAATRGTNDATLQTNINAEAATRAAQDLLRLLLTGGTMSGPIAMSGQKITGLAAGTNPGDAVRFEQLPTTSLITTIVNIGDWNMDTTALINVTHGIADPTKIREVTIMIRYDTDLGSGPSLPLLSGDGIGGSYQLDLSAIYITLTRVNGGVFDNINFNQTSFNRGWIVIKSIA